MNIPMNKFVKSSDMMNIKERKYMAFANDVDKMIESIKAKWFAKVKSCKLCKTLS